MADANIILSGFMGTGKSSAGRLVARLSGRLFVDTDELIVARSGREIAEIFRDDGERAFRELEGEVARELAGHSGLVIATGGRLMLDPLNASRLRPGAFVLCLTAEPAEILRRLSGDGIRRPLLEGADPEQKIRKLLAERAEAYGQYQQLATDGLGPEKVAREILDRFNVWEQGYKADESLISRLDVHYPGGSYPVMVGRGLLARAAELAPSAGPVAIVCDSTVGPLYARSLIEKMDVATTITVPAGEAYKRLETVQGIYDQLLAAGLDRQGTVIALGGGVIGDMAGFAAATYMRGVRFVQCPTSLLAMVDASVGGKSGVDLPQGKNLVGAFKQPAAVLADLDTLKSLPFSEMRAGLAEVVKAGLIASPGLFSELENASWEVTGLAAEAALASIVLEAIQIKRDVVEADPFESGRRRVLNLGHTFAHPVEQVSSYTIRHGEAVAMGLVAAARLSAQMDRCPPTLPDRLRSLLQALGLPTEIPPELPVEALLAAMSKDKKKSGASLRFILLRDIGDVFVEQNIPEDAIRKALHR